LWPRRLSLDRRSRHGSLQQPQRLARDRLRSGAVGGRSQGRLGGDGGQHGEQEEEAEEGVHAKRPVVRVTVTTPGLEASL
jgi:hypothetical protein